MDLLSGSLSETRTYTARSWVWVGRTDPCDLHDGTLTVQLTHGKTRRAGVETRRYFVQEIPSDMPGRCFLFLRDAQPDPDQSDIYRVDATEFGVLCSCKAAQCHAPGCVHADALAALLAAGAFDPALPVTLAEIDDRAARLDRPRGSSVRAVGASGCREQLFSDPAGQPLAYTPVSGRGCHSAIPGA